MHDCKGAYKYFTCWDRESLRIFWRDKYLASEDAFHERIYHNILYRYQIFQFSSLF